MLLKYINSNRLSVTVLFLLIPVVYWFPSMIHDHAPQLEQVKGVPFGRWILSFNLNFRVLASLIGLLLIIVNGYLLIQLNTVHIFIPYRTQLPLFFYIMLSISITQLHYLTPALVASTLLILVFYRILKAYKTDGVSICFLDAGLLISTASLFFFPTIVFYLFLLVVMILLRPFIWREWVFSLIGMMLPYAFVLSGYYLLDIPASDLFSGMSESFSAFSIEMRLSQIVSWSYILLLTLLASYYLAKAIDSMKIHARKFFLVFLAFFIFSVLIYLTVSGAGAGMVYFVALPLSYLFSYYFIRCKRTWINDIFFALFVLLLLWQRIN